MQEQLRALIEQHCASLRTAMAEVDACLSAARNGGSPHSADVERALELVHQVKGSSGSIGFGAVSEGAAELEEQLKALRARSPDSAGADIGRAALTSLDRLCALVEGLTPRQSTLFDADLSHLAPKGRKRA